MGRPIFNKEESMAFPVPGTNSWVTIAEADSYFADKWGAATTWAGLTAVQKSQLLISAYNWLRSMSGYSLQPTAAAAQPLKNAQFEAAWFLYRFNEEQEKRRALYAQGVRTFRVSEFSETLECQQLPANIAGLLVGYESSGGYHVKLSRTEGDNSGDERAQR